jgi:caa(3)-type oxidase subunit IV
METAKTKEHHPNYLVVYVGLLILTGLEVLISGQLGLGGSRVPILVVMSLVKALLVVLYYMHLKVDSLWYAVVLFFAAAFGLGLIGTFFV